MTIGSPVMTGCTHILKEGFFVRKIKKALALSLALAMGLSLTACGSKEEATTAATTEATTEAASEATTEAASEDTSEAGGSEATGFDVSGINDKAIYVYSWNDELGNRIDTYFRTKYPEYSDLVKYVNLNVSGTESEYPAKIQNAVDDGTEYPSVFASDESVMLSYADKDFTAPVSEAGITADMYANAYQYTVDFATVDGNLMACTWQATPGVLLYNKAMAEKVLGTSDPEKVQEMVSDWDGFFAVAEKIKAAGKYMVSGPDELKYPLLANKDSAWVVDGKLVVSDSAKTMLELSKKIYDGGYSQNSSQWSTEWTANMSNGTTFCFFGTTWFMGDTVFVTEDVKYQACPGPCGYYWGVSYLFYGKDCPNPSLAGLLIYTLTCDTDVMYDMAANGDEGCPNNQAAVEKAIADGVGANDKLDGQNLLTTFNEGAKTIDMSKSTKYDSQINTSLSTVSTSYNTGEYGSVDEAIAALKADVAATLTDVTVE